MRGWLCVYGGVRWGSHGPPAAPGRSEGSAVDVGVARGDMGHAARSAAAGRDYRRGRIGHGGRMWSTFLPLRQTANPIRLHILTPPLSPLSLSVTSFPPTTPLHPCMQAAPTTPPLHTHVECDQLLKLWQRQVNDLVVDAGGQGLRGRGGEWGPCRKDGRPWDGLLVVAMAHKAWVGVGVGCRATQVAGWCRGKAAGLRRGPTTTP